MGLLVGEEEEERELERRGKTPALGALRGSWVGTPGSSDTLIGPLVTFQLVYSKFKFTDVCRQLH